MNEKTLQVGEYDIQVTKKPKQKNIYVRSDEAGNLRISAPAHMTDVEIRKFVQDNLPNILKMRAKAMNYYAEHKPVTSHELPTELRLWGKSYPLEITLDDDPSYRLKWDDNEHPHLYAPQNATAESVAPLFAKFYRSQLEHVLPGVAQQYEAKMGLVAKEVRIKDMKTRWGTCNVKESRIWINAKLAAYPPECLEYIVVHELTHLLEPKHTARFWGLVEKYCPNYKNAEKLLDSKHSMEKPSK